MRQKLSRREIEGNRKRVNVSLTIDEYEDLLFVTNEEGGVSPGTVAHSIIVKECRARCAKAGRRELPGQQTLFSKGGKRDR